MPIATTQVRVESLLEQWGELKEGVRRKLISEGNPAEGGGRRTDSLLIRDLKPGDIIRITDNRSNVALVEVVDPAMLQGMVITGRDPDNVQCFGLSHLSSCVCQGTDFCFRSSSGSMVMFQRVDKIEILRSAGRPVDGF